jgi:hypothetical protein
MIMIRLATGELATVNLGAWTVEENDELTRVLNSPAMQPPNDGHYAPTEDSRKAMFVLKTWGGSWIKSDESFKPGLIY